MATSADATLAPSDAIALFIGAEGILLAIVAACLVLIAPAKGYAFKMGPRAPARMALGLLICNACLAVGASASWMQIYFGGSWRDFLEAVVALALLVGIAFPALAAYFFYRGFKD